MTNKLCDKLFMAYLLVMQPLPVHLSNEATRSNVLATGSIE